MFRWNPCHPVFYNVTNYRGCWIVKWVLVRIVYKGDGTSENGQTGEIVGL